MTRRLTALLSALWVGAVVTTSVTAQEKPAEKAASNRMRCVRGFEGLQDGRPVTARRPRQLWLQEIRPKGASSGLQGADSPALAGASQSGDPNRAMNSSTCCTAEPLAGVTVRFTSRTRRRRCPRICQATIRWRCRSIDGPLHLLLDAVRNRAAGFDFACRL